MLKKLLLAGLLLSLMAATAYQLSGADDRPEANALAPGFTTLEQPLALPPVPLLLDGETPFDTSAFRGKVVLLNLWASWCPPCIRELPSLDRLQQRYGDDTFEVVAVAVDRAGYPALREIYRQLGVEHLQLYLGEPEVVGRYYPIDVFPANFFLDPEGRVISYQRSQVDWDSPAARRLVESYKAR